MATQLFLGKLNSNDAPDLSAYDDHLLKTARDTVSQSAGTSTVTGPTSGVSITNVAPHSWWYRVNAVTISGAITKNVWMSESNMSANVGAQVIIDRCDGSGTFISTVENSEKGTELPATTRAAQNWATGTVTSTTFADGDYIRVRVYGNDGGGTMATGYTFDLSTGGTTAAADGDSYVTFTETITEYVAVARVPYSTPYPQLLAQ
jgi:hypothetical protein